MRIFRAITEAESRGDLDTAIANFRKAIGLNPSSATALLKLDDAYMRKQDYGAAIPPPEASDRTQSQLSSRTSTAGVCTLQSDQPAEAVVNLKTALAKSPDDPDLIYYLSRASAALSSESNEKLLAELPQTALMCDLEWNRFGRIPWASGAWPELLLRKMFSEAENEYEKAINLRPNSRVSTLSLVKFTRPVRNGRGPKNNFTVRQNCNPAMRKQRIASETYCCNKEK